MSKAAGTVERNFQTALSLKERPELPGRTFPYNEPPLGVRERAFPVLKISREKSKKPLDSPLGEGLILYLTSGM